MGESTDDLRNSQWQLLLIAALMCVGYVCMRTLRFTHQGLNLAFYCAFFSAPFLAIRPVLRLRRWPKILMTILITPLLALSFLILLITAICDVPACIGHRELASELSTVSMGHYSVHLLWEESAGGAIGPHGIGLEQRMFIAPGLFLVRYVDYFEGAYQGSLSVEGTDKVGLHIPKSTNWEQEVNRVYSLKPLVYF